jgi:hypothetical protein
MNKTPKFHNIALFAVALGLACSDTATAADAASLVKAGRADLAKQTSRGIHDAHKKFTEALKVSPNNAQANLLRAGTLILREHSAKTFRDELKAIGVDPVDTNPYDPEVSYPTDRNGQFIPTRKVRTTRTLKYAVSKRPVLLEALACLEKIKNENFRIVLSERETSTLAMTIDYGDVQAMRALAHTLLALSDVAQAYNWDMDYFGVYQRIKTPDWKPEDFLKGYPRLMGFAAASKRQEARKRLTAANKEIQGALTFVRTRKNANPPNFFEVEGGAAEAREASAICAALAKSLNQGAVALPEFTGGLERRKFRINLKQLVESSTAPRSLLPNSFDRGRFRPGSWKDRTMGGLVPDATLSDLDRAALGFGLLQNTSLEPHTFSTLAGRAGLAGYAGSSGVPLFGDIRGLAADAAGNIYVADGRNHVIRKITPKGKASDFVGKRWVTYDQKNQLQEAHDSSGDKDKPSGIFYNFGGGLAFDSKGNFFFTADGILYKFSKGELIHFAGGGEGALWDGTGKSARFSWPTHLAVGPDDSVYVCDSETVRKVSSAGVVSTIAGKENAYGFRDGQGSKARFSWLRGIAVDKRGDVFVMDTGNSLIRKISPAGDVSSFVGNHELDVGKPFDAAGKNALLEWPEGLAIDPSGNLYFADGELIRKVRPNGKVTTIGGKFLKDGRRDGTGEGALFGSPGTTALTANRRGVFVADSTTVRVGVPAKK